jgi:glycosyltransferase involved in cell wall biosynthesis
VTGVVRDAEREAVESEHIHAKTAAFLMINTLETGGSERQFVTIANALDRDKFSVTVGCLRKFGGFVSEIDDLHEFSPHGSLFGVQSWRARLALSRLLRRERIEVAQSFDFYANLMLIPAARFAGVPVVVGSHRQIGDLLAPMQFRAQNAMFRLCDRVICNSRAAAGCLEKTGIRAERLAVIPNGLPDRLFAPVSPALAPETGALRIGMIARMNDPGKGHDCFLRAAKILSARHAQLRFVLVGDGPLRPGLEEQARKLGLVDRVIFLGDRRDVPAVLASLDISLLPSSSESLSNVILESMAAGLPVVAARVGGNPELVRDGETGFLVPSGDDEAFAAALQRLLENSDLRAAFGAKAKSEARSRFALRQVCGQYEDLYRAVLSEKGCLAVNQ